MVVLAVALVTKDFSFRYVADYSSWMLAWYFSLAALWVGQAGSLLLWAWFLGMLALVYYCRRREGESHLRVSTLGVLMACLFFLVAVMVFGADPMEPSIIRPKEGAGLGPLLHHPVMLVHPPIVFAGYAAWTIPFAVAIAALASGKIDGEWIREARPWSILAWALLGIGILLGASWAYEELGWGGYWGWDPVENGSLIPWLTGTALIHAIMAWRHGGAMKKTAMGLSVATFGLCNFATFLTRSGIFSSVHAFSQSPIGWMFLFLMVVLTAGGAALIGMRRTSLAPDRPIGSLWSRESAIVASMVLLLLLAGVAVVGTITVPVSDLILGRKIAVGPEFYNRVLMPTGLLQLFLVAVAPLLRWGRAPSTAQKDVIRASFVIGACTAGAGFLVGLRHPVALAVAALAGIAVTGVIGSWLLDSQRKATGSAWKALWESLCDRRPQYCGFLIHIGFVCLVIGVSGSSLGTRRLQVDMDEGDSMEWSGRTILYEQLVQRELPDKLIAEAVLQIDAGNGKSFTLRPARHLHLLPNEWTTEVAIHSTWGSDFYTILHSGEGEGRVSLSFVENPLMRWIWLGGGIMSLGAVLVLWPARQSIRGRAIRQPHIALQPARMRRQLDGTGVLAGHD
jgi:cytochrome c-type biogenesis protein CcmF